MTARLTLLGSAVVLLLSAPSTVGAATTIACSAPSGGSRAVATTGSVTASASRVYRVEVSHPTSGPSHAIVVSAQAGSGTANSEPAGDARITKIILRSAYKSEAIAQPSSFANGATAREAIATFDETAVRELPAGDVNVVLSTADGERVCRIRKKDRGTLLHTAKP